MLDRIFRFTRNEKLLNHTKVLGMSKNMNKSTYDLIDTYRYQTDRSKEIIDAIKKRYVDLDSGMIAITWTPIFCHRDYVFGTTEEENHESMKTTYLQVIKENPGKRTKRLRKLINLIHQYGFFRYLHLWYDHRNLEPNLLAYYDVKHARDNIFVNIRKGLPHLVLSALDSGLDINTGNWKGETLLMVAARLGRRDLVVKLLNRGADPRLTLGDKSACGKKMKSLIDSIECEKSNKQFFGYVSGLIKTIATSSPVRSVWNYLWSIEVKEHSD